VIHIYIDEEKMSYIRYLKFVIIFITIAIAFIVVTLLPLIIAKIIMLKTRNETIMYIGVITEILWIPLIMKIIDYIWEKT
jgi:hypothetical protein